MNAVVDIDLHALAEEKSIQSLLLVQYFATVIPHSRIQDQMDVHSPVSDWFR
jgi:hypothetical protein